MSMDLEEKYEKIYRYCYFKVQGRETAARIWIKEALDELSEEEKEILLLRYVNEVSLTVIAEILHLPRFTLYRKMKKQ